MKQILKLFAMNLILIANILQSLWWMVLALYFIEPINYIVFYLQIGCVTMRILQSILIIKNYGMLIFVHIVSLIYYATYIESLLLMNYDYSWSIFSSSLLIIITYNSYLKFAIQKWSYICKLGLPFYIILRLVSIAFISFNYFAIECLLIIIVVLIQYLLTYEQYDEKVNVNSNTKGKTKIPELQLKKVDEKESPNHQQQSLLKSFSRLSIIQTPLKSQSVLMKDQPSDLKVGQFSNLTNLSKSQKQNKPSEKSDLQLHIFYQNLINIFPQGIVILNQLQQITYMNNKCEKLLESQGGEQVLEKIKVCVNNAKMSDNESEISNNLQTTKLNRQINQYTLQRIVRKLQKDNRRADIFDIMLYPSKYYGMLEQRGESYSQEDSKTDQLTLQQQAFIYEWLFESEVQNKINQKKLKLIIIPTTMTGQQQEYISLPSQNKFSSKLNIQVNNDSEIPVLLIMIKNVTSKHRYQQMKDEQIIHHSLIKSFSHELRTPLNSCQHMLNLIKNQNKENNVQEYVDIAMCSITLLIHQINDILDYAAIQSFSFSYHLTRFSINQITQEIENLYNIQMRQKKIHFQIKVQPSLKDSIICNDKQRILQIIVNLLNNATKYTKEGGTVKLSIKQMSLFHLKVSVKDNGIGIEDDKLALIQNSLKGTSEYGARLKSHQVSQKAGLGLHIAARLVEGLAESNNNQVLISSIKNQGTKVQFLVQNFFNATNDQYQSNYVSQLTGRFNQSGIQYTLSERKFDDRILIKQMNSKLDYDYQFQDNFVYEQESSLNTPKLNDDMKQPQISLPISPEYFSHKFLPTCQNTLPQYSIQKSIFLCDNCVHVLIVDDIPFNQIALKLMLKYYQIEADQAFDGLQAIEKVKTKLQGHCPTYKLIFMDIEMPGIDGFQTSKQINELTQKQSMIVICSAYDTQENFSEGQKVGISTFLPKPVKQDELEEVLKKLFQKNFN
ncbi:unnamed protein product (macronuclear) [Paramecium tetraurelia]|uniref:Uncharacterized protein n=1 Tax=Paramecium tetraurelia TaxID=5888 RepID=A0C2B7_PARTE|nr:uncharacterized protein GSPATT00034411001 [Paramecium tetraurelia]CAK64934.1 unnamed protein product [Paramecium tetraurelia]|eukprot:XP_001432331.1 hypothetical protein (macronuclear) [Paramecium tetraurelia strain d4-2]